MTLMGFVVQDTEEGLADLGVEDPEDMVGPEQSYDEVMKAVKELDQQQQDLVMTQDKISRRQLEKEIKVLESDMCDGEQKLEISRLIQDVSVISTRYLFFHRCGFILSLFRSVCPTMWISASSTKKRASRGLPIKPKSTA